MAQPLPDVELIRNDGSEDSLAAHRGNVLLVVNVASQCGLTPQYAGLQALYEKYLPRGFEVLGFPANDFGAQEPGTDTEIRAFCETEYAARFPLFRKASVVGVDKQPLYVELVKAAPEKHGDVDGFRQNLRSHGMSPNEDPEVLWNFEKFLIGREGAVIGRFPPTTAPDDPELVAAIESALAV